MRNKVLTSTRHVADDVFYQADMVQNNGIYTWALSIGTPDHMVTFSGDAVTPLRALSMMRNTLLALNETGNDILMDVKVAIDTLTDEGNMGIDPDVYN